VNAFLLLKEIVRATFGHEHIFKDTGVPNQFPEPELISVVIRIKKVLKTMKRNYQKKQHAKRELLQFFIN